MNRFSHDGADRRVEIRVGKHRNEKNSPAGKRNSLWKGRWVAAVCLCGLLALFAGLGWAQDSESDSSPLNLGAGSDATVAVTDDAEPQEGEVTEPPYEPKSKAELRRSLTSMQFKVSQSEGTEPAFRNKYWDNKEPGIYRCVVCGQSLFSSETKYKSGTGWPSFYKPIKPDHVGYKTDWHLFFPRKEVHCSRCNAHLGHVFDDGPRETTGKRYCMNSASLTFEKSESDGVPADATK